MSRDDAPANIRLVEQGRQLILEYKDGTKYVLDAEFLRVETPSAEARGHFGQGGELPTGKRSVKITNVRKVGRYAIGIDYSDGHDSGIYTWEFLHHLGENRDKLWEAYLGKLRINGKSRDPEEQVLRLVDPQ